MTANELVRRYLGAWNETDPERRITAVASVWSDDGRYVDPLADVEGHVQIAGLIGAVQETMRGHVFRPLGAIDAHHNVARFAWELVPVGGGESIVEGFDVAITEPDGRIVSVVGFLDKAPAV